MSPKQLRRAESGGQMYANTRARAKKLDHTTEADKNTSVNRDSKSRSRRKRQAALTSMDTTKSKDSPAKLTSSDDSQDTANVSNKEIMPKRTLKKSTKQVKLVDTLSFAKVEKNTEAPSTASNVTKTPEKPPPIESDQNREFNNSILTPKTSPVAINPTPRRTSKTPRKSPKELASPKTHSITPVGNSKVSRKLILPADSLMFEHNTPSKKSSPLVNLEVLGSFSATRHSMSRHEKKSRNSSTGKVKIRDSSGSAKHVLRRFSKSPKIVLKTPKPKSKRTKSPKLKLSAKRHSAGEKTTTTPTNKRVSISVPKTEPRKQSTMKFGKTDALDQVDPSTSVKTSLLRDAIALKKPIVVLQRLTISSDMSSIMTPGTTPTKSVVESAEHSPIITSAKSSPLIKTASSLGSRSSARTTSKVLIKTSPKIQTQKESLRRSNRTPIPSVQDSSEPLMSSTPHDKKRRSTKNSMLMDPVSKSIQRLSPRSKGNRLMQTDETSKLSVSEIIPHDADIENESEPSLYQTDVSDAEVNRTKTLETSAKVSSPSAPHELTVTVEGEREAEKKDGTYELLEPKTPNLREKSRKRSFHEANLTAQETKKNYKVRFASPTPNMESTEENSSRPSEKKSVEKIRTPSNRSNRIKNSLFDSGSSRKSALKSSMSNPTRRLNSITNGTTVRPAAASKIARRSNSFGDTNTTISSSFSFSHKKTDSAAKYSATKKVPNFAKIHNKMFAKSESLVDAKKRLEDRHTTLSNFSSSAAKGTAIKLANNRQTPLPNEAANGPYNRFGFKLRKTEATDCVMKKRPFHSRLDQQQKNRDAIKGVRMNRRFELQMKARNIKL